MIRKVYLCISVPPALSEAARSIASRERRSVSAQVQIWIEQGVEADRAIQAGREIDEVTK